jgi:hypothetical protein
MKRRKFLKEFSKRALIATAASRVEVGSFAYGAAPQGTGPMHPASGPPEVSNRAPKQTVEIGYLPAEGTTVGTNPPALAWLTEPGAQAYTVQLARDAEFTRELSTISNTPYVLYTHTVTLAPGTWWWRYACEDGTGARSGWSKVRNFTIASDAQAFPRPSEEQIQQRLPSTHPRLMMRPEEVEALRKACLGPQKERWNQLRAAAEESLSSPLTPEPPPYTNGKFSADEWRRNYTDTINACATAETLALCYRLSGEARYGEGARKWLLHIASWDPAGTTSLKINDECGMPILYVTSRAYDWAYDALSEPDREKMRAMIRARGEEAYKKLHGAPHEQKAYDSHQGRLWHFLGEAALAYYGEVPEAKKWLDYAFTIFWGWYPAFGDADGGWAQGLSYWKGYVLRSTWWLDALKAAMNIDGTEKPFYRHVGDFSIYVAPPGGALVGFADYGEDRPGEGHQLGYVEPGMRGVGSVDAYFARLRRKPEWQWYAEAWGDNAFPPTAIGFLRALRPDPPIPKARPPVDWPKAKWFRGVGWVSLHTNLIDGREDVQVMMRASLLGNISHSHADQNAMVLGAYGSPLLVNTGIRPWWGSPFFWDWYIATKAHNALEINGKGQPKTETATGKVIVFQPGDSYDYVVGDASPAYGKEVKRYRRHLLFLKPGVLVMVDEVQGTEPISVKSWLHGRAPFTIDESTGGIALTFERAALKGFLLSTGGLEFAQTDKYPYPPELGTPAPEWHLTAETKQKQEAACIVAALGIGRAGESPDLTDVKETSDGKTVTVQFRHAGKRVKISFDLTAPKVTVT